MLKDQEGDEPGAANTCAGFFGALAPNRCASTAVQSSASYSVPSSGMPVEGAAASSEVHHIVLMLSLQCSCCSLRASRVF